MPSFLMLKLEADIAAVVIVQYDITSLVCHCTSTAIDRAPISKMSVIGGRSHFCKNCSNVFAVRGLCVKKWQITFLSSWGFSSSGMWHCGSKHVKGLHCLHLQWWSSLFGPLNPWRWGFTILCTIRHHMPSEAASHARRPEYAATPPWDPSYCLHS